MLNTLSIRGLALIEELELEFHQGLTVISGETGAGKSILIDAFGLLLGRRASRELVRDGCDRALVEALFFSPEKYLSKELMAKLGLEADELILSRELRADGRSIVRINGHLAKVSDLAEIASQLIAIHGQNSQEEIYEADAQMDFLDQYASEYGSAPLEEWQSLVQKRRSIVQELKQLGLNPRERERELELLDYQLQELSEANLQLEEDDKLERQAKKIAAINKINSNLDEFEHLLAGEGQLRDLLGVAISKLNYPARFLKKLEEIQTELALVSETFQEIDYSLSTIRSELEADVEEQERVIARLNLINDLKRKYGEDIEEILNYQEEITERFKFLKSSARNFELRQKELREVEAEMAEAAPRLLKWRTEKAKKLEREMAAALTDLNLPKSRFAVRFTDLPDKIYAWRGPSRAEFFFSANAGENLKLLSKVASGGEASRLILALKSLKADEKGLPILIFDEIDQGVGGQTAARVGDRLKIISKNRQVFCVTHSASIAAQADNHIFLDKCFDGERTKTSAKILNRYESEEEIARLLAGQTDEESLALARRLMSDYERK